MKQESFNDSSFDSGSGASSSTGQEVNSTVRDLNPATAQFFCAIMQNSFVLLSKQQNSQENVWWVHIIAQHIDLRQKRQVKVLPEMWLLLPASRSRPHARSLDTADR